MEFRLESVERNSDLLQAVKARQAMTRQTTRTGIVRARPPKYLFSGLTKCVAKLSAIPQDLAAIKRRSEEILALLREGFRNEGWKEELRRLDERRQNWRRRSQRRRVIHQSRPATQARSG